MCMYVRMYVGAYMYVRMYVRMCRNELTGFLKFQIYSLLLLFFLCQLL